MSAESTTPSTGQAPANGQTRRRARTRAALLGAASALLSQGRTTASIEEITQQAGVGFGSFYNHFATKEELFTAALLDLLDGYTDWMRSATADLEDPAEIFAASFRLTGRLAGERPDLLAPLLNQGTEILLVERGLRVAAIADIEAGIAQGRFAEVDPEVMLMTVGGALLGLVRLISTDSSREAEATTDVVTTRVLCLLGLSQSDAVEVVARPLPATSPQDGVRLP